MFPTASNLPETSRNQITKALILSVAEGLDFYSQVKTAHWNVKGPHFLTLHPFFDQLASAISETTDTLAERATALGSLVPGTVRQAALKSSLPDYDVALTEDLKHAKLVLDRLETYLKGLRHIETVAEGNSDSKTANMLQEIIASYEKHGWFLVATTQGR